ncbi:hypothetical protein IGI04_034982, partial [Brassica rapa subsp. trilocularis]
SSISLVSRPPAVEINHVMSKIHCDDHDRLHKDNEGDKKIDHIRLSGPVGSNPSNGPLQPEQQNLLGTVE